MKIKFISPHLNEIDVSALGITFQRGETVEVSDSDGALLMRSPGLFANADGEVSVVEDVFEPDPALIEPESTERETRPPEAPEL